MRIRYGIILCIAFIFKNISTGPNEKGMLAQVEYELWPTKNSEQNLHPVAQNNAYDEDEPSDGCLEKSKKAVELFFVTLFGSLSCVVCADICDK